jgi:hypothetical protein
VSEYRAAFIGGPLHGRMMPVSELAPVIFVPVSPEPDAKIITYTQQPSLAYAPSKPDDRIPTKVYFQEMLSGRTIDSLKADMLWPEAWRYVDA